MPFKQPRSVQVVIFSETPGGRRYLLLRRIAEFGGFWQTVTGSLEEGESHMQAAVREVYEETGIVARQEELIDLELVNFFEIPPKWIGKYAPGVTHNEEVCFALQADFPHVKLDSLEHDASVRAGFSEAFDMVTYDSTRKALAATEQVLARTQDQPIDKTESARLTAGPDMED